MQRKQKIAWLFLLILYSCAAEAQQYMIDSLNFVISNSKSDPEKIKAYFLLQEKMLFKDFDRTAITLAEQVLQEVPRKRRWVNEPTGNPADLVIISKREDPAPGTHSVKYSSPVDDIEIIHTAHSREGFALGAVLAVEYIRDKKGIFTMQQVLGIS